MLQELAVAKGVILKKHRESGTVKDMKIPGRERKTTAREDSLMVRKSKADRFKTAPQIKAEMNLEYGVQVSTSTAQRRLREAGMFGRKPRKKPRLTLAHKEDLNATSTDSMNSFRLSMVSSLIIVKTSFTVSL